MGNCPFLPTMIDPISSEEERFNVHLGKVKEAIFYFPYETS